MRLHGILCWYDESPSWLGTAVAGFSRFCDHILAVDGAYALYPGGRPRSHPRQAEVIVHTAEAAGIACTLYQPADVWWGNEIEKRNKSLDIIGAFAEDGDWLCVFDADYHLMRGNPASLKVDLERSEHDVATYGIVDAEDWAVTSASDLALEASLASQWTSQIRDLYRWHPTIRVGPAHGDYSDARYGPRRWLRGPYELAAAEDVSGSLTVYHRTKDRAKIRKDAQQGYYKKRDILRIEEVAA